MNSKVIIEDKTYSIDLNIPLDISIPLRNGSYNPKAWHAPDPKFEAVIVGDFIGSVKEGAPVNFFNVFFNPHGNGTHTECLGHVTSEQHTINQCLRQFWFPAFLMTVEPIQFDDDLVISKEQLEFIPDEIDALVIRTTPNSEKKLKIDYSGTNPAYLDPEAMEFLVHKKIKHLLIDLPSVDPEVDDGLLESHHIFWQTKGDMRKDCTITEMIYVDDSIKDGDYLLNLQIAPLELDASPSKPILYKLTSAD